MLSRALAPARKLAGVADSETGASFSQARQALLTFRDAREWSQFHTPKDLAAAISIEAGELLEHFLWKDGAEVAAHVADHRVDIASEMADVLAYLIYLGDVLDIDLPAALAAKVARNGDRYPVDRARGSNAKHDRLAVNGSTRAP